MYVDIMWMNAVDTPDPHVKFSECIPIILIMILYEVLHDFREIYTYKNMHITKVVSTI